MIWPSCWGELRRAANTVAELIAKGGAKEEPGAYPKLIRFWGVGSVGVG